MKGLQVVKKMSDDAASAASSSAELRVVSLTFALVNCEKKPLAKHISEVLEQMNL